MVYIQYGVACTAKDGMDGLCQLWRPVWCRARMRADLWQWSAGVTGGLAAAVQTSNRTVASLNRHWSCLMRFDRGLVAGIMK